MMETQVKLLKPSTCIFLNLLAILTLPLTASAHPVVQYWQNRTTSHEGLLLEPRISYYTTSANFDQNSQSINLLNQTSVNRFYFDVNATYHLPGDLFLFGRLSVLNSTIKNPLSSNRSISGLSDQLLGLAYRLVSDPHGLNLSAQLDVVLPAYQNDKQLAAGEPLLGDQSTDITAGLFAELPLGQNSDFWLEIGAGYTYRNKNYSAAVPYSVMLKKEPEGKGFLFSVGARGQFSLNTDNTLLASVSNSQLIGAGGSYLINAINPSWTMAQGEIGYKTASSTSIYALVAGPITAKNAPSGIQASVGMQFDFGAPAASETRREETGSRPTSQPVAQTRTAAPKKVSHPDAFTTYNLEAEVTSVNDQLFLAKINKGLDDGVEKGQLFDVFKVSEDTVTQRKSETPIARVRVTHVKNDEAALTVVEYYKDQWIERGFVARRVVQ